jgi:hypothetical protein
MLETMNHAGDDLIVVSGKALAIVGSHPATRENAPYDDERFEIWLMIEAPQKPEVYKRWDAALQIHGADVYANEHNWVNSRHWEWLQEKRGKPIWMQEVDARVPDSVRYPIEGVLKLTPYRYLRSTPAMALALAIYLGYGEIWLYGSELSSNTEYAYQATNYAFWIGFAHGRGIDLHLECWQAEFSQRIYGYEGELQLDVETYAARVLEIETSWKANENALTKLGNRLNEAMLENQFDKVGTLSVEIENAAIAAGTTFGILSEARRYAERTSPISRQEFERAGALAQNDGDELRTEKDKAFGKCEYVWNAWKQSGKLAALNQLRTFLGEKTKLAYDCGVKFGIYSENLRFMSEYDRRLEAAGGVRALGKPEEYRVP